MENVVLKACGLDVHQAPVTGCILRQGVERQIKTFGTTTPELLDLKSWLHAHEITHVAMESTGVFWKPVINVLGEDFQIIFANARHIKNVPGRKTDVKDCEWICQLLRAGLLQPSFIPAEAIRDLRDIMRYQRKLQHQMTQQKNRVHKLLHEANIKITGVLTDIFGATGMSILRCLSKGVTDPGILSELLLKSKKLVPKIAQAKEALTGCFSAHHQFLLQSLLRYMDFLQAEMDVIDQKADALMEPFKVEYELLQTIPGVKQISRMCWSSVLVNLPKGQVLSINKTDGLQKSTGCYST